MQFRIEDFSDQLVDVFYLAVYVFLEHSEPFGVVKHLKGRHPTQQLHRFVHRVVHSVVGVLVEHV